MPPDCPETVATSEPCGDRFAAHRLEHLCDILERTGDYRVTRRLAKPLFVPMLLGKGHRLGVFADVETTGLDPKKDEVIELALVPFSFDEAGEIVGVHKPFSGFRQPSRPIPIAVTALTGIDDAMVAGRGLAPQDIPSFLTEASICIAHNAGFDRAFLELAFPVFRELPWACSLHDVAWRDEGIKSTNLEGLASAFGFFHEAHRATDDCCAVVEILRRRLPRSGQSVMGALLDRLKRPTFRVWALNAPFAAKDLLKARGYRWNAGDNGGPRSWYRDVERADVKGELSYLQGAVFARRVELPVVEIDAFDRHSERSWQVPR